MVTKIALRLAMVLVAAGSTAAASSPATFYVAPKGSDTNPGTEPLPFASLEKARDALRALKRRELPPGGATVVLAPGVYRLIGPLELQSQDSGAENAPVVYRAAKRGTAILTGGAALVDWHPVSDPQTRQRLDPAARAKVVVAQITEQMLKDLPGFANGFGVKAAEYPVGLYQGGERLPVARWPNEGYALMGECLGASKIAGHVGRTFTDGVFRFDDPRLKRWIGEPELWFNGLWFHPWADERIRLQAIDAAQHTIALAHGHYFGFKKGQEFYAFNALSEIDRPGEWALDRAARRVYLWPTADVKAVPPLIALGDVLVKADRVAHLTFDGLVFEACRQSALVFKDCTAVTVAGSTVRHTGGWGARLDGGQRGTVIGCDLYDLGEGGVDASGGDRTKLTPGGHLIENNLIHHFGRIVSTYRPAAAARGVGHAIRHNLCYQADHQAIAFDGNDHRIEYNIVHDVCLHTSDAGPLYACARDWSKRGTVIRHNLFHAAGEGVDGCGCRDIYLDDWTSGTAVRSNIVSQANCGINLGGGRDNQVTDNIVINCQPESISLHSRGIDSFAKPSALKGKQSGIYKLLDRDLYKTDLWRGRYPQMLAPLEMDPVDAHNAHGNAIRQNLIVGSPDVKISNAQRVMRTCVVEQNVTSSEDPGFVAAAALDLRLRPDAAVYKQLPGFQAPDFAKMGLYHDPRRASPAVKFGPQVTPMDPIMSADDRAKSKIAVVFPVGRSAQRSAEIRWAGKGTKAVRTSVAELSVDGRSLQITVRNDVDPTKGVTSGSAWGRDDGLELALAVAHGPGHQDVDRPLVLRGYAGARFESLTLGGAPQADAERLAKTVRYTAKIDGPGRWSAHWDVPLAALKIPPVNHLPVLTQITVFRSADGSSTRWAQRPARHSWEVQGAQALWLRPLGDLAFVPGARPAVSRVAISWGSDKVPMVAGRGAENPTWCPSGSRIEAQFGSVLADRWYSYEFEFTAEKDGLVSIELMGTQGEPTVWTYYDDIRVEGAELTNGDFEIMGPKGLAGWRVPPARGAASLLVDDVRLAASGSRLVMASHDFRFTQPIRVIGGRKVTVRFKARGALGDGEVL